MRLHIAKMACDGCVKTVTQAIESLDPAAKVTADMAARDVTVETAAAREAVEKALAAVGYPARAA